MGDRRMGDRRAPDKGVIKISFKSAVIYLLCAVVLIVSISANIVLARYYIAYKKGYEELYQENQEMMQYNYSNENIETQEVEEVVPEETE